MQGYDRKLNKEIKHAMTLIEKFLFNINFRITNSPDIEFLKTVKRDILHELRYEYVVDYMNDLIDDEKLKLETSKIDSILEG